MAKVFTTPLPAASRLWAQVGNADFIDGYAVESHLSPIDAVRIGLTLPVWASALLKLRNLILKPFGLKTEASDTGETAIFPMHHQDDRECIIGTDDTHLNFRICVFKQNEVIHMATWVHRNNWFGRLYLAVVMPFHVLIVRNAMRRIAAASSIASTPAAQ